MLSASGISKSFGAVRALDAVDLRLRAGEIHCLMGENGAGKSTFIKCLSGVHRPDAGRFTLAGEEVRFRSPREAEAAGVSTVFQEVSLIPHLTVADNIGLGREPRGFLGAIDGRALRERARRAVARLGLELDVARELSDLPVALRQLVAIARAIDVEARVLVLDEPTSSLDREETERLFAILRRLREEGLAVLLITHFLDQVFTLSDRITVFRDGGFVGEYETAAIGREELVRSMVGREFAEVERGPDAPGASGTARIEARGLRRRHAVENVDLTVREGECVGLAGLLGSGRSETARLLFGADRADGGEIRVDGAARRLEAPRDAIALGIAFTPEERKADGLVLDLSVRRNIELAWQARRGLALSRGEAGVVERLVRALDIRTPSLDAPVGRLSGGNQQKVLIARWLALAPRVLILDEPTRGIDVAARAEILREIEALRAAGTAVLLVSSEVEELVRCCDRVVVLRDRRSVAELSGAALDENRILEAIAAGHD
ncbi:MAG: sugar ABC transporter ATP-binding protein [Planctomycetota bacterium]